MVPAFHKGKEDSLFAARSWKASLHPTRVLPPRKPQAWAELDPHATNFIPAVKLASLIAELDPPLGVRGEDGGRAQLQGIIMRLDVPVHSGGQVRLADTR
jgi:hypothetical protein